MTETTTKTDVCVVCGSTAVKSYSLCNTHYMAKWRAEERQIGEEIAKANREFGTLSQYLCEGADDCDEEPVRWWAKDGGTPLALCSTHTDQIADAYRLNLRRLGAKT